MNKFNCLLIHIMDLEKKLEEQLLMEIETQNPNAVLTNTAHDAVKLILKHGYGLLFEKQEVKPQFKLIQGGKS